MKTMRSKQVRTEESVEKEGGKEERKRDWVFHSLIKNRKKAGTPLRFADVAPQRKGLQSTQGDSSASDGKELNESITQAISVLKEHSGCRRERTQAEETCQQPASITPFSLEGQLEGFEEQLSFKGAGHRLTLLSRLDSIQSEANSIFQEVKHLNQKSSIDFITFKLLKSQQKDLKISYFDFYSHLQNMAKKISDLVTQLTRCRNIMGRIGTGITKKTMELYSERFQGLTGEMRNSVGHLRSYVEMLNRMQRERRGVRKCGTQRVRMEAAV